MNASAEQIEQLLNEISPSFWEARERAQDFNFIQMLGLTTSEVDHSRMLAFFLDPHADHGQRTRFLKSFLTTFLHLECTPDQLKSSNVFTEESIGKSGKLDLLLRITNGPLIAIENKINAPERENQIARYKDWLTEQRREHFLIYLTPDGRQPTNVPKNFNFTCVTRLSYLELQQWMCDCLSTLPERLKPVAQQCAEAWHLIGSNTARTPMNKDVEKILRNPDNFNIALKIAAYVEKLKEIVRRDFWSQVKAILEERLGNSDKFTVELRIHLRWLGIFWRGVPVEPGKYQFSVMFEVYGGQLSYGVYRGGKLEGPPVELDVELVSILKQRGFQSSKWCSGYKIVKDNPSEAALLALDQESIRNLATKRADELWSVFEISRSHLVKLNEQYPRHYPSSGTKASVPNNQ